MCKPLRATAVLFMGLCTALPAVADSDKTFSFYKLPLRANAGSDSGAVLQKGLQRFMPVYECSRWSGNVLAHEADANGNWVAKWTASAQLPPEPVRKVWTWLADKQTPLPFTFDRLAANNLLAWTGEAKARDQQDLINYLRGERTHEAAQKSGAHSYRDRLSALGDTAGAGLVHVGAGINEQYVLLLTGTPGQSSYLEFLNRKAKRSPAVYAGANDGMLHAFDASTGQEVFAYLPSVLLDKMRALSQTGYAHDFYVNGALALADVYDKAAGTWRSLLIGTLGAGGKGVFALDVSDPLNPLPLWEIDSKDSDPDWHDWKRLGGVVSKPEVGLLANGDWAVMLGNGYGGSGNPSELLVVNALTGNKISRIAVASKDGDAKLKGLSGVRVLRDFQQRVVAAFAGDLNGNFWRFDLESTNVAEWRVGFGGAPLFKDPEQRPMSASPALMDHPLGGTMLLLGTGKLLEKSDPDDTSTQRLYGVWDKTPLGKASEAVNAIGSDQLEGQLVKQSFESAASNLNSSVYRSSSANPVQWGMHRGWRLDLTLEKGQRAIDPPTLLRGFALFHTLTPPALNEKNACAAQTGGSGYAIVVNALSGARPALQVLSLESVNDSSSVASAWRTDGTAAGAPLLAGGSVVFVGKASLKLPSPRPIERTWRQLR
jgi:type IV pilus assembly protein PilY1